MMRQGCSNKPKGKGRKGVLLAGDRINFQSHNALEMGMTWNETTPTRFTVKMPLLDPPQSMRTALSSKYERRTKTKNGEPGGEGRGDWRKSPSKRSKRAMGMIQNRSRSHPVRGQPCGPSRVPDPPKTAAAARMALPIPVWDCSGHSRHEAPPSFPSRPDDADRGAFQAAPSYAAGFHFRPPISSDARSPSVRAVGGGRWAGPVAPATTHRCAVGNGPVAVRRTRAETAERSRMDWTSAVEPLDARPSLFVFWVESFDTRTGGGRLDVANTAIRVGSFPMAWGDLDWLGRWAEPNGGNKSSGRMIDAPVAVRFAHAVADADQVAVSSMALSAVAGSASRRCSTGEAYWRVGERTWAARLPTPVDAFALDHRANPYDMRMQSLSSAVMVEVRMGSTAWTEPASSVTVADHKGLAAARQAFEDLVSVPAASESVMEPAVVVVVFVEAAEAAAVAVAVAVAVVVVVVAAAAAAVAAVTAPAAEDSFAPCNVASTRGSGWPCSLPLFLQIPSAPYVEAPHRPATLVTSCTRFSAFPSDIPLAGCVPLPVSSDRPPPWPAAIFAWTRPLPATVKAPAAA